MANRFQDIIVNASRTLGMASGAFTKAKEQMLRRPDFVAGLAQESQWQGGNLGVNTEAAQRRAARNSWFYAGVNKKALDLSGAKLDVYNNPSGLEDDGIKADAHPFYNVLRRPNPYMGKSLLMQYTQWWLDLSGEAFWFMNPERGGIKELWPMPSNKMDMEFTPDGKTLKRYIAKLHQWYYIDPAYIIHFKYPNPWDFFRGLPPLIAFMLTVDADLAMKMWNGSFFGKDNVMPSAVISLGSGDPSNMFEQGDVDAVRDELRNEYSAIQRKTVVTNANSMSVALLGYNAKDMDFLAGMQWNKEEILIALGVPPGLLDKNATEANAKVGNVVFKEYMWGSKCLIGDEITTQCLQVFYNENLEARFEDDRIRDRDAELKEAEIAKDAMPREQWAKKYFNVDLQPGDVTMSEGKQKEFADSQKPTDAPVPEKQAEQKPVDGAANSESDTPKEDMTKKGDVVNPDTRAEFNALFTKAINFYKQKRIKNLSFTSTLLDGETLKAVLSDLRDVEMQTDIGFIKDHWESVLFSEEGNTQANLKALSWRPWSMFEQALKASVHEALGKIQQIILDNASETLPEDGGVWTQIANVFKAETQPTLFDIAEKAVKDTYAILSGSDLNVSFDLSNQLAREWTLVYAGDQIKGIDETTKKSVRKTIDEWIAAGRDEGKGIQGLRDRLTAMTDENGVPLFGEARAERIAQSEITSIYAGAKEKALVSNGYPPTVYKPRAHVSCRCFLQPARLSSGEKVIVWFTARDERVCVQPLETPFGIMNGCKELHRKIVSEGHAGETFER